MKKISLINKYAINIERVTNRNYDISDIYINNLIVREG